MNDPLRRDTPLYMNVFCDAHNTWTDQAYDAHDHAGVNQHRPIFSTKALAKLHFNEPHWLYHFIPCDNCET